jgi:hypothetical protein
MWVWARFSVAERDRRVVARELLITWVMRTTSSAASTNPWGTTVDDGWKDLVVSSAPPPPPAQAIDPPVKNRALPDDFNTWQEHGAPKTGPVPLVDEPSFSAGDRRLWVIAGTLMGLAVLVLGVLGMLTFGNLSSSPTAPAPVAAEAPRAPVDAPRAVEPVRAPGVVITHAQNPRVLKAAAHSSRARHHKNKKVAER